jgi:hypothetical protein
MTAHLARHGPVNHTSNLFRPTLQRSVHRLEALTRGVKQATAHKADQQAGEALGVVQAATGVDNSSSWNACSQSNRPGTSRRPRQRSSRGVAVSTTARNVIGRRPGGAIVTLS